MTSILTILIGAITSLLFAFFAGKKSKENKDNEKIVTEVREVNLIKEDTARISDSDLHAELSKWQQVNKIKH